LEEKNMEKNNLNLAGQKSVNLHLVVNPEEIKHISEEN
jgi:hypothetical protein